MGRPSKLSDHQKDELKDLLHQKDNWTTKEVGNLILRTFIVENQLDDTNWFSTINELYPRILSKVRII